MSSGTRSSQLGPHKELAHGRTRSIKSDASSVAPVDSNVGEFPSSSVEIELRLSSAGTCKGKKPESMYSHTRVCCGGDWHSVPCTYSKVSPGSCMDDQLCCQNFKGDNSDYGELYTPETQVCCRTAEGGTWSAKKVISKSSESDYVCCGAKGWISLSQATGDPVCGVQCTGSGGRFEGLVFKNVRAIDVVGAIPLSGLLVDIGNRWVCPIGGKCCTTSGQCCQSNEECLPYKDVTYGISGYVTSSTVYWCKSTKNCGGTQCKSGEECCNTLACCKSGKCIAPENVEKGLTGIGATYCKPS